MSDRRDDHETANLTAHAKRLRALARSLVRDEHLAEDLVQDTYVAALRGDGPTRGGLGGWLAAITRNLAKMAARTEVRRKRRERLPRPSSLVPGPEETVARLETEESLLRSVRELPEPYRSTLVSRYLVGLSAARIARETGVPASTVRTRVDRALAMLKDRLDEKSGGRRAWVLALLPLAWPTGGALAATAGLIATGVTIMATKKVLTAAVAVVLLAVCATLWIGPDDSPDAPPRTASEVVTLPNIAGADGEEPVAAGGSSIPAPFDLDAADRDLDLHGRVVNEKGDPVAGARIETVRWPWRRSSVLNFEGHHQSVSGPSGLSATDGSFLLRLRRAALVDLRVTAGGYGETVIPGCQAGERLTVVLGPGAELLVTCRDESSAPVASVELVCWRTSDRGEPVFFREGVTNAAGECLFTGLTDGTARLRIAHAELGGPALERPEIPRSGRVSVAITMVKGRTITGRVTDVAAGAPVSGARVGAGWSLARAVRTDAYGRYSFTGWRVEDGGDLHATAAGYGRLKLEVPEEGELDFALRPGDTAIGRLLGADGRPVEGALVSALAYLHDPLNDAGGIRMDPLSGTTDAEGRFRVTSLRRDLAPHTLVIQAAGHAKYMADFDRHDPGPGEIDFGVIRLGDARRMEGRVLDDYGEPIPGATVDISLTKRYAIPDAFGGHEKRRTDDLGRFRFCDLAPGEYGIMVSLTNSSRLMETVEIPPGRDVLDLVLTWQTTRDLTVLVLDPDGEPSANRLISTVVAPGRRTGKDGVAVLDKLPRQELRLYVHITEDDLLPFPGAVVPADATTLTIRLARASLIRGRVLDPTGEPAHELYVQAHSVAGRFLKSGKTDADGRFLIKLTAGDTVDLYVTGLRAREVGSEEDWAPFDGIVRGVTAPRDGVRIATKAVVGGRSITVRVVDLRGRLVAGSEVALSVREIQRQAFTAEDGTASFEDLPASEAHIWVSAPEGSELESTAVNPKRLRVVPDGQRVEMKFRRGTWLSGIVLGPKGKPQPGVTVSVMTDEGVSLDTETDATGRFRTPALPGVAHRILGFWIDAEGRQYHLRADGVVPGDGEMELRMR